MFNSTTIKNYLTTDNMSYDANEEMSAHFWDAVDRKLKESHLSRAELARRSRLSNQSMTSAKYLRSSITIFTVMRITKALGCTVEDLIYDKSDAVSHRDDVYSSLAVEATEDAETCEISSLAEDFNKLTRDSQLAVLVHVFSLLGVNAKNTIERIEDATSIEGENK